MSVKRVFTVEFEIGGESYFIPASIDENGFWWNDMHEAVANFGDDVLDDVAAAVMNGEWQGAGDGYHWQAHEA